MIEFNSTIRVNHVNKSNSDFDQNSSNKAKYDDNDENGFVDSNSIGDGNENIKNTHENNLLNNSDNEIELLRIEFENLNNKINAYESEIKTKNELIASLNGKLNLNLNLINKQFLNIYFRIDENMMFKSNIEQLNIDFEAKLNNLTKNKDEVEAILNDNRSKCDEQMKIIENLNEINKQLKDDNESIQSKCEIFLLFYFFLQNK